MTTLSPKNRTRTSPDPTLEGSPARRFRHEPYDRAGRLYCYSLADGAAASTDDVSSESFRSTATSGPPSSGTRTPPPLPEGTLHRGLHGRVPFVPYPAAQFALPADAREAPAPGDLERGALTRVFFGQLPYGVTDMQLGWLCYTLGAKCVVVHPERITKRQPKIGGKTLPTGCLHAYATPRAVEELCGRLHKSVLVDDTGVWFAQRAAEKAELRAFCDKLKTDPNRPAGRPYDAISVERAISTAHTAAPVHVIPAVAAASAVAAAAAAAVHKSPSAATAAVACRPPSYVARPSHAANTAPPPPYHAAWAAPW